MSLRTLRNIVASGQAQRSRWEQNNATAAQAAKTWVANTVRSLDDSKASFQIRTADGSKLTARLTWAETRIPEIQGYIYSLKASADVTIDTRRKTGTISGVAIADNASGVPFARPLRAAEVTRLIQRAKQGPGPD